MKKAFPRQHGKNSMQIRQSDILGNYAGKILGHCPHRLAHKFAVVREIAGHVAQTRDRVACP